MKIRVYKQDDILLSHNKSRCRENKKIILLLDNYDDDTYFCGIWTPLMILDIILWTSLNPLRQRENIYSFSSAKGKSGIK